MPITPKDIVPFSKARAELARLARDVRAGHEKVITRNGERYVALVDARKLDYYHQLEREAESDFLLSLLQDAHEGVKRIRAGEAGLSVEDARERAQRRLAGKKCGPADPAPSPPERI